MTFGLRTAFVAGVALAGLAVVDTASAMPAAPLAPAFTATADGAVIVENVRLVCPPFRPCFRTRGYGYGYRYRPYRYYGYRHYYRPRYFY